MRSSSWLCRVAALMVAFTPALNAQPSPTAIVDRIRTTGAKPIDFHAALFPDTVYVGQQVTYQVAVLLSDQARSRLRRNPEFLPPELRGLLAYELGAPRRVAPRSYGGGVYEAHVFQRALFGVAPGALTVPAPQLSYSLPQSASYFSREERYVVRAESAQLVVRPLPDEGRPGDFTGAVGVLRASARLDGTNARVGDPLVLTIRLEGTGNVKLLPRPTVELSWASVVPGSERIQVDTSGALVRGAKEFDFLVTPAQPGAVVIPVVRYSYFDPYKRQYGVAETVPADVVIGEGALAANVDPEEVGVLPLREWQRTEVIPLTQRSWVWGGGALLLMLIAPCPALLAVFRRRREQQVAEREAIALNSPREAVPDDMSPAGVARQSRRLLLQQLSERLHVAPTDLVARRDVEQVLRRRGVTRATTRELLQLLDSLAEQGFGAQQANLSTPSADTAQAQRVAQLFDRVHREAVSHGRTRLWSRGARRPGAVSVLLLVVGLGAAVPTARAQTVPCVRTAELEVLVQEGTAAYTGRRYASAAERFETAVVACPRDVDLLVNWGNAAWAAADTVSAVVAWHRAARLEPLAADVQERLAMLPAGARGGLADVPMVPVSLLYVGAVLLWCAGWLTLWWTWRSSHRQGSSLTSIGVLLLVGASVSGAAAYWGQNALNADQVSVVRRPEPMRAVPGFDANTAGGVTTGDMVRVIATREGWQQVQHADGRRGWIPASRLVPLLPGRGPR